MPPCHPVVFIGSSTHGLPIAHHVARLIQSFAIPRVWNSGTFLPSHGVLQKLLEEVPRVDAALLILTPDDRLEQRRDGAWSPAQPAPRDNVVFEVGLWIGALGCKRVWFLEPSEPRLVIPSDLAGVLSVRYPALEASWGEIQQKLQSWLGGDEFKQDTRPIVQWPNPHAAGRSLLVSDRGEACHGLLLLGNTMAHTQAANQADLARWLSRDPRRRIGMLFLNPHSPHARGRGRPMFHRGTAAAGLAAYQQAVRHPIHSQCVPLLYDGPYRYSLRGLDVALHTRNTASEIHVTHSTHLHGIDGAFSHSLPYHRGAEAFESFSVDALTLWKSAHANPPGHGISLAACWEPDRGTPPLEMDCVLTGAAADLLRQAGREGEVHLNPPSQWHFTFSSLRRTGRSWEGPFSLTAESPETRLPPTFADYAVQACERMQTAIRQAKLHELVLEVTHLRLTDRGHLITFHRNAADPLVGAATQFLATRAADLQEFKLDTPPTGDFAPKHAEFWPHVAVGMAFHNDAALPEPLTRAGPPLEVELARPLSWRTSRFHAVHYAYRTFRRIVGAQPVPLDGNPIEVDELIRSLAIA